MTEIALRQDTIPAPVGDPTGGRLIAWAQAAHAANQLAKALIRTSFVPDTFKIVDKDGNIDPGNATAAIIMGDELGMSPLASLRGIYVFKGTPALYARTMRALALAHGHAMWNEVSTDTEVVVCGQRKGSSKVERVSWTIARATKAKYTNNPKYQTEPQAMLQAKADSEVARKIAADVLAGVPYSVEDLELEETTTTVTRTAAEPPKTVRRKPAPVAEPEEPAFDGPPAEPDPQADPAKDFYPIELVTKSQLTKLHILFKEKGLGDRDDALAYLEDLGYPVASSKDLTKDGASHVIESLDRLTDVAPWVS